MKIAVIDDYQNAFKTLKCFPKLSGHEVSIYTDPETDIPLSENPRDLRDFPYASSILSEIRRGGASEIPTARPDQNPSVRSQSAS